MKRKRKTQEERETAAGRRLFRRQSRAMSAMRQELEALVARYGEHDEWLVAGFVLTWSLGEVIERQARSLPGGEADYAADMIKQTSSALRRWLREWLKSTAPATARRRVADESHKLH